MEFRKEMLQSFFHDVRIPPAYRRGDIVSAKSAPLGIVGAQRAEPTQPILNDMPLSARAPRGASYKATIQLLANRPGIPLV